MHNILSRSQLDEWRHCNDKEEQKLNDYYECLIESSLDHRHEDRKICKQILLQIRGVANPLFLCYDDYICNLNMDREKLKLIVKNLKSLVNALESEVYSDVDAYNTNLGNPNFGFYQGNDDDDGYAD